MKYEIEVRPYKFIEVSKSIFWAWSGKRKINGKEYIGKVYSLGHGKAK